MLRSFRLENHLSVQAEQELSLLPVYDKGQAVVPVAAIFGPNAAGKSNLLDALDFMRTAVRRSYAYWEAGAGVPRTPFRLSADTVEQPSGFAVELLLDGIVYVYGFNVDDQVVNDEWLWAYPHRRKRVLFERHGQQIEFGSTVPVSPSRADFITGITRPNSLLLSAAAQADQPEVLPVYSWFRTCLEFPESSPRWVDDRFVEAVRTGARHRQLALDLLRAADPNIVDVEVAVEAEPRSSLTDQSGMVALSAGSGRTGAFVHMVSGFDDRLRFRHGHSGVEFSLLEQSAGTRHWMNVLGAVLYALEHGTVVCVDEIDASLHPRLTARLVELFRDQRTNRRGAQLIVTTHDVTLLGTSFGREILSRDQIWFVEKDEHGATTLFPLSDFQPRKEDNRERRYLGGSYGGVPAIFSDTLVERILAEEDLADAAA